MNKEQVQKVLNGEYLFIERNGIFFNFNYTGERSVNEIEVIPTFVSKRTKEGRWGKKFNIPIDMMEGEFLEDIFDFLESLICDSAPT